MDDQTHSMLRDGGGRTEAAAPAPAASPPAPTPTPPPAPASGLYEWKSSGLLSSLGPVGMLPVKREELRLDVDGRYPQLAASGTLHGLIASQIHWIAKLEATGPDSWAGQLWYKDGATASFPYTRVEITALRSPYAAARRATATFTGPGVSKRTRTFPFASASFREVDFEFDWAQGKAAALEVDTGAHPNRPASLAGERLTIPQVFGRAGFKVTQRVGGPVPISGAKSDGRWSDAEMHDAMQVYWSRFANQSQWAMWVFFAGLHEKGTSLGGIMFDRIGKNHRQGTALFVDSFIASPPARDPNPAAWVERMRFWTACHEMGHAFNLAHSWDKSKATSWVPLADEPEARSFMNYPYNVKGGQTAFFADFQYRFSDPELLFMRHAPAKFVQMGNAAWFDHHAFEEAEVSDEPGLELTVRANRDTAAFEFLEPVTLELKLSNRGDRPRLVDRHALAADALTVVLKRDGQPARQLVPFAQRCEQPDVVALEPGRSLYEPLFASAGLNGWDLADPGRYTVQVAAHVGDEDVVSEPLRLVVRPPASRDEEFVAQDLFTEDAGRVLALGGSRVLDDGIAVLQEVAERLPERRVALHAQIALGAPLANTYKQLVPADGARSLAIEAKAAAPDEARVLVGEALTARPDQAADSFGHVEFHRLVDSFAGWLAGEGDRESAVLALDILHSTLSSRTVHGRPVKAEVLAEIASDRDAFAAGEPVEA